MRDKMAAAPQPLTAETLIRLANGCRRAASRGNTVRPFAHDLSQRDIALIATVLSNLAEAHND